MQFKFCVLMLFATIVVLDLTGCVVTPVQTSGIVAKDVSAVVVARAQLRWNALLKRDTDTAYQFISPGGRSLMTVEQYRPRLNTGFWRGAKVEKATCDVETCEVTVLVDLIVEGVKFTNPIKETWILDAGKWWFVYQG